MPVRRERLKDRGMEMKTYSAKKEDIERQWFVIDAQDQVLGRLATRIAHILRGKNKPTFTNHVDTGDFVIVVNAEKIRLTGNKLDDKVYYRHSGYPGGIKGMTARKMLERKPEQVIKTAVKGMLPKNRLGSSMISKLKVYTGPEHPHEAQKPEKMEISRG
jgi:large subunit ribosomal protein L13